MDGAQDVDFALGGLVYLLLYVFTACFAVCAVLALVGLLVFAEQPFAMELPPEGPAPGCGRSDNRPDIQSDRSCQAKSRFSKSSNGLAG